MGSSPNHSQIPIYQSPQSISWPQPHRWRLGTREQRWRHGEAERLRSLEIDRKLELGRLFDRDVGCERVLLPQVPFAHKGLGERMTPIIISTIAIPVRMLTCRGSSFLPL
jgi:hypothetical protein